MPLYEYECGACHRRTEKIQKFSDPEITTCPFCGGVLARTITAPAIQFKGAGWYKDLYSSAKPPAPGSPSGEGSGSASGDGGSGSAATKGDSAAAPASPASTPAPASTTTGSATSGSSSTTSNN